MRVKFGCANKVPVWCVSGAKLDAGEKAGLPSWWPAFDCFSMDPDGPVHFVFVRVGHKVYEVGGKYEVEVYLE